MDIINYITEMLRNLIGNNKNKRQKLINILKKEKDFIKILDKILNMFINDLKV